MSSMTLSQSHVGCFVTRTVLGKSGKQFNQEMERLLHHNGPEWLNERLKAVWNASIHLRNGDKDRAIQIYQENSIAYHKGDGTPKGPIRPAVVGFIHSQKPSKVKAFSAVLRFYSSIQLNELSEKQSRKAYNAITEEPKFKVDPAKMGSISVNLGPKVIRDLKKKFSGEDYIPPIRSRYANPLRATSYYYSREKLPKGMRAKKNPYSSMALSFMTETWIPESLDGITPIKEMRDVIRAQGWETNPCVGRITPIQEQGAKARVVAMPSAALQLAMHPLHRRLSKITEHAFPVESCVKDQTKGARGVLDHLRRGNDVYAVDLSSATDRFPREFSTQILTELGMNNYSQALEEISDSYWDSPWGPVKYQTGQPMGLYGSFPLFNLSNLLLAKGSERSVEKKQGKDSLNRFKEGNTFYIIGDDIIFSDYDVSKMYRAQLDKLGVDVSEHKSYSGKVAEFAGFLFVPTNKGHVGFRPYKPSVGSDIKNPVTLLDAIGSRVQHVNQRWKQRFDDYSHTASLRSLDLSPLFPEKEHPGNSPYRGDSSTFVNLSNVISMMKGKDELPDLSGSTKVNRIPLFAERGVGDYYGFSPDELASQETARPSHPSRTPTSMNPYKDPLMKKAREERPSRVRGRQESSHENVSPSPTISPEPVKQVPNKDLLNPYRRRQVELYEKGLIPYLNPQNAYQRMQNQVAESDLSSDMEKTRHQDGPSL